MGELWTNFSGNRMRRDVPRSRFLAFFGRERPVRELSKIIASWKAHSPHGQLLVSSRERTLATPKVTYDTVLVTVAERLGEMYADERTWPSEFFAKRIRDVTRPGREFGSRGAIYGGRPLA